MASSIKFRTKILNVGRRLTKENINDIKFVLKEDIGEGALEGIGNGTDLLDLLETRNIFSKTDLSGLLGILEGIERQDIIDFLLDKQESKAVPKSDEIKERLDQRRPKQPIDHDILDFIANLLAADWKRTARFLQLPEHKIEIIENDCRKTYERSISSLNTWMRSSDGAVNWTVLKNKALLKLPRYDIIRDVEAKYPQLLVEAAPSKEPSIQNGHINVEESEEEDSSNNVGLQDTSEETTSKVDAMESPVEYALVKGELENGVDDQMQNMSIKHT